VTSVSWSPDGSKIASGSYDKTVRVWDSSTGAVQSTLEGHYGGVTSVSWSPDGSKIASESFVNSDRG
jgi:WD40 repeat protein